MVAVGGGISSSLTLGASRVAPFNLKMSVASPTKLFLLPTKHFEKHFGPRHLHQFPFPNFCSVVPVSAVLRET